ncbi:ribonuclease BN [Thermoanaerobacterium sp. RBIITD]|uniref:ribonuclease BN n=1 Tax=Thermoanaerobacterium sp. RBIITD TaxID=1550240 RepID=UPI000BB99497|nr:ribonuclease BN [Thermoanaerobacterium sp. RBIITD]
MKHSIFRTLKLLILGNIFLIPFSIVVENLIIRLIIGSAAGISFIMLLSFITKIEAIYTKDKKY